MKVLMILIDHEIKEAEVWMQREKGIVFIVHPLFVNHDGELNQVGIAIDDNKGDDVSLVSLSFYDKLNHKCELIGVFSKDNDFVAEYGMTKE